MTVGTPSPQELDEHAMFKRHLPNDFDSEMQRAIDGFLLERGQPKTIEPNFWVLHERRSTRPPWHPVIYVGIHDGAAEGATEERMGFRGIAVVSALSKRFTVATLIQKETVAGAPLLLYKLLPSSICPDVLSMFGVRGVPHQPDAAERTGQKAWDRVVPELSRSGVVAVRQAESVYRTSHSDPEVPPGAEKIGGMVIRVGAALPALDPARSADVSRILRAPSSYINGIAGCAFGAAVALSFPEREQLMVVVCFQCRQILFVRGNRRLDFRGMTSVAAQELLDVVRTVMPSLPEKLPD